MSLKSKILSSRPGKGQAAIFYLGQETILIKAAGKYFLFDPYLDDYVDRNFSTEAVVWKRNYPSPIDPGELDFIDYVFCSHAHGDHTDPETLTAIAAASPKAVFIGGNPVCRGYSHLCGIDESRILRVKADAPVRLGEGISVTAIPAAHEQLHPDGKGSYEELGFLLTADGITFYHAGDCCPYDGLTERVTGADVAFLPINGRDYFRLSSDIIGNFDSVEAITLAKKAGVSLLIPLHFDLYNVNSVNPAYFVDCIGKIAPGQQYHIFMPGEKYLFEK